MHASSSCFNNSRNNLDLSVHASSIVVVEDVLTVVAMIAAIALIYPCMPRHVAFGGSAVKSGISFGRFFFAGAAAAFFFVILELERKASLLFFFVVVVLVLLLLLLSVLLLLLFESPASRPVVPPPPLETAAVLRPRP